MDINKFDMAINNAQKSVEDKIEICEQYMNEFMKPTVRLCSRKIDDIIEEVIIKEPQITKKHGDKGLQELLSKKNGLLNDLPNIVEKEVQSAKIWKHKIISTEPEYEDISDYFMDIYDFKKDIKGSLGRVLGYGVKLLLEYGYLKKHSTHWYESDNNKIVYREEIEFNHEMDTIVVNYLHSYHSLYESFRNLENLKRKRDEQEAKNLLELSKSSLK